MQQGVGPRRSQKVARTWGSLALIAATALGACTSADEKAALIPEGAPEIKQIFMTEKKGNAAELNLGFGCGDVGTIDCSTLPDDLPGQLCCEWQQWSTGVDGNPDTVRMDGSITEAVIAGQTIRIIVDELLRGQTIEQFRCACSANEAGDGGCPNGIVAALDPTFCDNDPATDINENGRFADQNQDRVPDDTLLLPGIVQVDCDNATMPWVNGINEGWYNPSGSQQVPINTNTGNPEWTAIGPAVVLQPEALPTGSTCTLHFNDMAMVQTPAGEQAVLASRDKEGNVIPAPDGFTFTTEIMKLTAVQPANNASNVAPDVSPTVTFNAPIAAASVTGVTLTETAGGAAVDGTASVGTDGRSWQFTPSAPLAVSTGYTITITTSLTDKFGAPFPEQLTRSFTTRATP